GQVKFQRFGIDILKLINDLNAQEFAPKLNTIQQTLLYYEQGKSLEEICEIRKMTPNTVLGHLCKLFEENHPINLNNYVTEYEVNQVKMAKKQLNQTNQLKPIFEHLSGEIDYRKISVALTILSKYH
ncbi:MAG: helix-turn-helix domain-containing protein, partial [Crocinitomix sp.]|nr:helix-turn-helix domain-containing protein [Crocinitomix sp.]